MKTEELLLPDSAVEEVKNAILELNRSLTNKYAGVCVIARPQHMGAPPPLRGALIRCAQFDETYGVIFWVDWFKKDGSGEFMDSTGDNSPTWTRAAITARHIVKVVNTDAVQDELARLAAKGG